MWIKLQVGKPIFPYLSQNDMVEAFALLLPMILRVAFPCALIFGKQMSMQITRDQLNALPLSNYVPLCVKPVPEFIDFYKIKQCRCEVGRTPHYKRPLTPLQEDVNDSFSTCCFCTALRWRVFCSFKVFACVSTSVRLSRFLGIAELNT